jgi:hypothetical protein
MVYPKLHFHYLEKEIVDRVKKYIQRKPDLYFDAKLDSSGYHDVNISIGDNSENKRLIKKHFKDLVDIIFE